MRKHLIISAAATLVLGLSACEKPAEEAAEPAAAEAEPVVAEPTAAAPAPVTAAPAPAAAAPAGAPAKANEDQQSSGGVNPE